MPDSLDIAERANGAVRECAPAASLRIAIGIATVGRPQILLQTLSRLAVQTRRADAIYVAAPSEADFDGVAQAYPDVVLVVSERGSSHQRNAILDRLDTFDVAVFFDDDFVPHPDYLAEMEKIMLADPGIVMTTGDVLRDGILGPGLGFAEADAILAGWRAGASAHETLIPAPDGYGCNMSARLSAVRRYKARFDENLPLYAWLEDVDFSRQLAQGGGRIVKARTTCGVHLGVKSGRQRGLKLGYSQIANPIYLSRKGTVSWRRSLFLMSRNVAANLLKTVRPEPWIDRKGRLSGNMRAIFDLIRGRLDPGNVVTFK